MDGARALFKRRSASRLAHRTSCRKLALMHTPGKHKHAVIIAIYFVGVLVLGALFAPALFAWGKGFLGVCQRNEWDKIPSLAWFMVPLGKTEFRGYFDRAVMIVALAGLWPMFKALRIQRSEVLGTVNFVCGSRQLLAGFALAVILLFIMGAVYFQTGVCTLRAHAPWFVIGAPLTSAFTVACIEEFLFRGAVLGVLRRSLRSWNAVVCTTFLFAVVHFLKAPANAVIHDADVRWWSGFQMIPQLFSGFGRWQNVLAEFLLLAAVGCVLARMRVATNGLWAGIGLHAGWVFGMKYFSQVTLAQPALHDGTFSPWIAENTCKAIVGSYVGLIPVATVLFTGALMLRLFKSGFSEKAIASDDE